MVNSKNAMKNQSPRIGERARQLLSLEGKVAVVTGAASGIGRGIALRLSEMGAFVAVLDIDENKGRETVAEIEPGRSMFLICDVRSAADCLRSLEATLKKWSQVDILCNCAGIA